MYKKGDFVKKRKKTYSLFLEPNKIYKVIEVDKSDLIIPYLIIDIETNVMHWVMPRYIRRVKKCEIQK